MIHYKQGNLLDVTEGCIVHGCNAKGVMGSGVAKAIKDKYPKAYKVYKDFETNYGLRTGSISLVAVKPGLFIANAVTQETYGKDINVRYVSYGAVHLCFERLDRHFNQDIVFHLPKIGAGLGNGEWSTISHLIELACPGRELICWSL